VRAGAAVVTDENQKLLGIFTHAISCGHFSIDSKIGERLVRTDDVEPGHGA